MGAKTKQKTAKARKPEKVYDPDYFTPQEIRKILESRRRVLAGEIGYVWHPGDPVGLFEGLSR